MLKKIYNEVTREWDTSVEEALKSFIRLPALSPDFDKKWEENGVLTFMVEDNGCGMTKEVCGALLKGETVPSKKGSGMGVRNVQERIRLLFGPDYGLDIESEPDEGTKVFIRLPAVPYEKMKEMEAEGHE